MELPDWNDSHSVGVKRIDDEHRMMLALVNQLCFGLVAGHGRDRTAPLIESLLEYTRFHFRNEEQHLTAAAHPNLTDHRAAHAVLLRQLEEERDRLLRGAGPREQAIQLGLLRFWLLEHIKGSDRDLATLARPGA